MSNADAERSVAMEPSRAVSASGTSTPKPVATPNQPKESFPVESKSQLHCPCERENTSSGPHRLVDKLSSNIEQYKTILTKLFPSKPLDEIEALVSLPREELLQLALASSSRHTQTTPSPTIESHSISDLGSGGAESLEALEQAPPQDPFWDEARKHQLHVQGVSDDVNGLALSVERLSSYVGISSITAALKVMMRCAPQVRPLIAQSHNDTLLPSRAGSPTPELADNRPDALPPYAQGQALVESYFECVHPFFPMIEERKFWSTYLLGDRKDSPWLALLNIVFALGSLASSTANNEAHYVYFNRSRLHLSFESFGSGNLEVLQALAIMSGYYMHYLNRPNEAHSLMGGVLRMATALGLHREYSDRSTYDPNQIFSVLTPGEGDTVSPENRRRIWWSLFCLDTWASTTTGRPSLGRMGPSITVLRPGTANNSVCRCDMPLRDGTNGALGYPSTTKQSTIYRTPKSFAVNIRFRVLHPGY